VVVNRTVKLSLAGELERLGLASGGGRSRRLLAELRGKRPGYRTAQRAFRVMRHFRVVIRRRVDDA
jgi:hypothetical protein